MLRLCIGLLAVTLFFCASLCLQAASPPAEQIFPDGTKGFFSIHNFKAFGDQWKQTQFGKLMDDPLMQRFENEVKQRLTDRMEKTFGLTFDSISSLPSGEVAFGMIAIPGRVPGYVLTMDVAGKQTETDQYLANLTQKLVSAGVKKSLETYKGHSITSLVFPPAETPRTLQNTRVEITFQPIERRAYYTFVQDVLVASDQIPLLRLIVDRLATQGGKSLADVEAYQTVMQRCARDLPAGTIPTLRWYLDPLDYGESIRTVLRGPIAQNRREKPSIFSILSQQGFDAIQGIGGTVSIKTEAQESVYRTFVYTKKPYRLAMQMLNFPDNINFVPPTWMPDDLARCTLLYVNPSMMFGHFGGLFDALVMPGEAGGVWNDILMGLEEDPYGPQINLREEFIAHLGNRVWGMSRYAKPIIPNSENLVIAVELITGHEPAMQGSLKKLFGNDPEMKSISYRAHTIWNRVPQEKSLSEDEYSPMFFPEGSLVAANGFLFASTNLESLKAVLDRLDSPAESAQSSVNNHAEYKEVEQIFVSMGLTNKPHFYQFFGRTYETLHPTYEMIRTGQMAQSQTLLGRMLNEFFLPEKETGVRRQFLDGSTLPEFDKIEHYFGKVGIAGTTEENGYFIKGFTVERK